MRNRRGAAAAAAAPVADKRNEKVYANSVPPHPPSLMKSKFRGLCVYSVESGASVDKSNI